MGTKDNFLAKWDKAKGGINKFIDRDFDKLDWVILISFLGISFFLFVQGDILVTGNRSFLMYHNLMDFYDASYEWTNSFGANYLPSTFWVFAIWNFPMYLMGYFPENPRTYGLFIFWYKLLPVIIYIISSFLMKNIALKMEMSKSRAKLCQLGFILSPIGFYSQFIFSQYDIFTVFFMLLGIYYYLCSKKGRFVLFFGIAATFKYHALVYFMALLVLSEKKVSKIIFSIVLGLAPALIEIAMYINSPFFVKSVFGFSALTVVDTSFLWSGFGRINICIMVICLVLVLAYVQTDINKWSVSILNGINFAFFGCLFWNPQWLLIAVPFIVLGVMASEHGKLLVLVEMLFSIALWARIALIHNGGLDTPLLRMGILGPILKNKDFVTLTSQIYGSIDISYINTIILASFIVFFVLSIPRNLADKHSEVKAGFNMYLRLTFMVSVICFFLPVLICVKDVVAGKFFFFDTSESAESNPIALTQDDEVIQKIYADGNIIDSIYIMIGNYGRTNDSKLFVRLTDEDDKVLYSSEKLCIEMNKDNSWYNIIDEKINVEYGEYYYLSITTDAVPGNNVAIYEVRNLSSNENAIVTDDGTITSENQIKMKVIGR